MITKIAIRLRIRPPKRRSPSQRLKAKLYYRRNKTKIKTQRKRYLRTHRSQLKNRKLFQRFKPTWLRKPKTTPLGAHKFKVFVPKKIKKA